MIFTPFVPKNYYMLRAISIIDDVLTYIIFFKAQLVQAKSN